MLAYLDSIQSYIGFGDADAELLRDLLPIAEPHLASFTDHFYDCIAADPDAHEVIKGPEQAQRLKKTFTEWMGSGLQGPHDQEYYHRRARIGRIHVTIGLSQRFMFTAMNVVRRDLHHLVDAHYAGHPELRQRANDAIDRLLDMELAIMLQTFQEDSDARLRRHERLATIGQVAASIGHDLRNPLGVIQSSLYLLRRRAGDDARIQRHLDKIDGQTKLCDEIICKLLELVRSTPPRRERIALSGLFQEALEANAIPPHIQVETHIADGVECQADAGLLRQALVNLIANALQAQKGSTGRLQIIATMARDDFVLEVADDGPGFDGEVIQRAFEPLVTTRSDGTGLGLALVKGVTERHGGRVEAENRPGGGALVRMILPGATKESVGDAYL